MGNFFGALAVISVVPLLFIIVCRVFKIKKTDGIIGGNGEYSIYEPTLKEVLFVGTEALAFRILMYIVAFLLLRLVYMNDQTYLDWWTKWDATNYIGIAEGGYSKITIDGVGGLGDNVMQTLVFFPLYPVLVAGINVILNNTQLAALVTSTICFASGCMVLYMAIASRYGKEIAEKTLVLISVSPFAFFFGGMLPESTFLLVTAACMYFTIKRKWLLAGIMGVFCGLARMQGILIIAFMGMEWLEEYGIIDKFKNKKFKNIGVAFSKLPLIFMPFIGTVIYLIVNYAYTGDFMYFMKLQNKVWSHKFTDIFHAIHNIWANLAREAVDDPDLVFSVWGPQLVLFFFVIVIIYLSIKEHADSMTVYLLIYLIISYSTDYLVSGGRYMSTAIPLFIMLAVKCSKSKVLYRWIVAAGLCYMIILMGCHVSGYNLVT